MVSSPPMYSFCIHCNSFVFFNADSVLSTSLIEVSLEFLSSIYFCSSVLVQTEMDIVGCNFLVLYHSNKEKYEC